MDTIVAISTALGQGAISIIRLSGDDAFIIANKCFKGKDLTKVESHTINYGKIYDKDEYVDEEYYALYEATKDNSNVSLCGDLTLNWVLDINLNSSKTLLYKYGFSRNKTILDKSDQVFGNLTHIEHFQFVKKCSQKGKKRIIKKENVTSINSDKIILDKYSLVIIKGREASIPIKSLPNGYSLYDLRYETDKAEVVTINNNGIIQSKDIGNCKITIKTKDEKFKAYLNVLVSTG